MHDLFYDSNFGDVHFGFAVWGPIGSQLVFSYNNDLYYKDSAHAASIRLTVTGITGVLFNGHTDWLYEEEILNSNKALWFSPYGTELAYLQINCSLVDVQSWSRYGEYFNISNNQYSTIESVRYPKPGKHNPEVTLYVINLNKNVGNIRVRKISPPNVMNNE